MCAHNEQVLCMCISSFIEICHTVSFVCMVGNFRLFGYTFSKHIYL